MPGIIASACPALVTLRVDCVMYPFAGTAHLTGLRNLKHLDLSTSPITLDEWSGPDNAYDRYSQGAEGGDQGGWRKSTRALFYGARLGDSGGARLGDSGGAFYLV
jgi:hypothetical protein